MNDEHGLKMPLIVWGFSKLNHGVSIWSEKRVVTHIIVNKGKGFNIVDIAQTCRRGAFQGLDVLKKNGFTQVTIMTTSEILDTACRADKYVDLGIQQVEDHNIHFKTAMRGVATESRLKAFPADTDVCR